jgi:carboxymethylenebutenolidase
MYPPRHPHRQAQGQIAERALLEKIKIRDRSNIALELRPTSPEIGKQSKGDTQVERKRATDFPQGLLDLFDHYVHGEISRRQFLDGATKFAAGGLTAVALWESLRPKYALAEQVPQDDKRLNTEYATVPSPQGNGNIRGYYVRPANTLEKLPGVLVIHENRGLNPYIEDVARRLGIANYLAFAPDGLTSVGGYPGDDEKGAELFRTVDENKMFEDFVASAGWLKSRPECSGKVGVVGFCLGGTVANKLAVRLPDLAAAVSFYGRQPSAEETAKIKAPLLLHYASLDTRVNGGWPAYEEALKANHVSYTAYIYEGANHGFHNDTTPRYDESAAKLAWQRTLDFFNMYLRAE